MILGRQRFFFLFPHFLCSCFGHFGAPHPSSGSSLRSFLCSLQLASSYTTSITYPLSFCNFPFFSLCILLYLVNPITHQTKSSSPSQIPFSNISLQVTALLQETNLHFSSTYQHIFRSFLSPQNVPISLFLTLLCFHWPSPPPSTPEALHSRALLSSLVFTSSGSIMLCLALISPF